MKGAPTTRGPSLEVAATQAFGAPIARSPAASARLSKAYGDWRDVRGLEGRAGAASGAPAGAQGRAGVAARTVARLAAAIARELRIRRDMRTLSMMDDHMLRDIGLTRADIGRAVRYGRD